MAFKPAPKLCYFQTKTELQGRKHRFKEKVSTFCFFTVYSASLMTVSKNCLFLVLLAPTARSVARFPSFFSILSMANFKYG